MRKVLALFLTLSLLLPLPAFALDQADLLQKIEALSKELESLKTQMQEVKKAETAKEERITMVEKKAEEASETSSWIELGGDYRFRYDYLKAKVHDYWQFMSPTSMPVPVHGYDMKNDSLMTNRLGINLRAKATEDIQVKVRLLMYKIWGEETFAPASTPFADKFFLFDGNVGHVPESNLLQVDQAYATWSNIADAPVWLSVGRRPSTGGVPSNIRMNTEKTGTAGVPALMVDYAFDGATLGVAPDIEALPGAYAKVCYGKGFDSGFRTPNNSLRDVNFLGVNLVPYDTENFHAELQWDRAFDLFAFPETTVTDFGWGPVHNANIGDVDQFGVTILGKLPDLGPGDLNLFASGAISITHPNGNTLDGFAGLLEDCPGGVCPQESHTGGAIYLGARYDFKSSGTKIGLEYNHGSKNWIAFDPGNDDMWTGKLGTHGNVYEGYIIQELNWLKPISKRGKAFVRLGYQYYDFEYTGSSNWIGAPKKISELDLIQNAQMMPPVEKAHDLYFTFDVTF